MAPRTFVTYIGFIILIVGVFSPLISPLGLVKWNLGNLNHVLVSVLIAIAFSGTSAVFKKRNSLVRVFAWLAFAVVLLIFIATATKINTTFGFIPFPKLSNALSGLIRYRWGWYLLFGGPILALLGSANRKSIRSAGK